MNDLRTATEDDFEINNTLIDSEGNKFTILCDYGGGSWEARGRTGNKCIFEDEAKHYKIKK